MAERRSITPGVGRFVLSGVTGWTRVEVGFLTVGFVVVLPLAWLFAPHWLAPVFVALPLTSYELVRVARLLRLRAEQRSRGWSA